jgi:hypothetical protein
VLQIKGGITHGFFIEPLALYRAPGGDHYRFFAFAQKKEKRQITFWRV